jgi:hypothetical protein
MSSMMEACRASFGSPPREFSNSDRRHLRIWPWHPLLWIDSLMWIYGKQGTVRRHGQVVWGHIVQANEALFSRGFLDLPADVVYSFDPYFDTAVDELAGIASGLFGLKGTRPADKALRPIARHLTAETTRAWRLPVPTHATGGRQVFMTTVMVIRRHLPQRHLAAPLFPVIACPSGTAAALILSSRYWPPSLLESWGVRE